MIERVIEWYMRKVFRRIKRDMERMYPDTKDRATAHFAMGADLLEIQQFGQGELLDKVRADLTRDNEEETWLVEVYSYKLDET